MKTLERVRWGLSDVWGEARSGVALFLPAACVGAATIYLVGPVSRNVDAAAWSALFYAGWAWLFTVVMQDRYKEEARGNLGNLAGLCVLVTFCGLMLPGYGLAIMATAAGVAFGTITSREVARN